MVLKQSKYEDLLPKICQVQVTWLPNKDLQANHKLLFRYQNALNASFKYFSFLLLKNVRTISKLFKDVKLKDKSWFYQMFKDGRHSELHLKRAKQCGILQRHVPPVQMEEFLSAIHCRSTLETESIDAFSAGGSIGMQSSNTWGQHLSITSMTGSSSSSVPATSQGSQDLRHFRQHLSIT